MRRIVYYVASSIDGFISRPGDDISGFVAEGTGVQKYLDDLAEFDTVIMGKNTYEFGYRYGLKPGEAAYKNMKHYIFSNSLKFETQDTRVHVCKPDLQIVKKLKTGTGADIYLCGGGEFAGWLLENQQIDLLKIKLNPLIAGGGTKLFGSATRFYKTEWLQTEQYDRGLQLITYRILY